MEIQIKDESNDRGYFTIVPNYVLNHSTAIAQALYLQLKRLAGEEGIAYPGSRYLRERLKISQPTLRKEFKYLLEKGWIKYAGEKDIETDGGNQKIKCYRIVDIWQLNNKLYQRGEKIDTPCSQRGEKIDTQGVKSGGERIGTKEDPCNKIHSFNKNNATPKVVAEVKTFNLEEEVDKLVLGKVEHLQAIGLFIDINELNPTNRQQLSSIIKRNSRAACLLKGYSKEQIIHTMSLLKKYAEFRWTIESVGKYIDKPEEIKKLIK